MAALVEGHKYGLSSISSTSADKTVIYLKLTDSALRAIEESLKQKNASGASIQFLDDKGSIKIPVGKSSTQQDGHRTFSFTMSSLTLDPKGSFDCVQQKPYSQHEPLQCLGQMSSKIVVKATEDIYQTTRDRMALAEEESKKNCAKEIKPSGPHSGSRIKKVLKHHHHHKKIPPKPMPQALKKPIVTPSSRLQQGGSTGSSMNSSSSNHGSSGNHGSSSLIGSGSSLGASGRPTAAVAPTPSQNPHIMQSSSNNSSGPGAGMKPSPTSNPAIMNMPYRDRIIHLLAIRPYKKPELICRLQRDGVKEKDRKALGSILPSVSTFSPRDNTFTLAKKMYSEVRDDWPFYNEADLISLKRRRPVESSQTTPTASPSPVPSPTTSIGSQNSTGCSPTNTQKRPSSTSYDSGPHKKQRIAHYRKEKKSKEGKGERMEKLKEEVIKEEVKEEKVASPAAAAVVTNGRNEVSTTTPDSSHHRHKHRTKHKDKDSHRHSPHTKPKSKHEGSESSKRKAGHADKQSHSHKKDSPTTTNKKDSPTTTAKKESPKPTVKKESPMTMVVKKESPTTTVVKKESPMTTVVKKESPTTTTIKDVSPSRTSSHQPEPSEKSVASSTSETPDYVMKYTVITRHDQRQRYKKDFNEEYGDYRNLHESIAKVSAKFTNLEQTLNKAEKGSEDYENVKNKIVNEYLTIKQNPKYLDQKKRCQYLHEKLAHIKKLIIEYDQAHMPVT